MKTYKVFTGVFMVIAGVIAASYGKLLPGIILAGIGVLVAATASDD